MKVIAGDWLMNAGIIGYLRMRKLAGKRLPDLSKEYIEVTASDLEGYTDWYFTHVLMRKAGGMFRPKSEVFSGLRQVLDNKQFADIRAKFAKLETSSFDKIKQDYNDFEATLQSTIKAEAEFGEKAKDLAEAELAKYPSLDKKDIAKVRKQLDEAVSNNLKQLRDKRLNFVYVYLNSFYRNKNVIANPASKARKKSFNEEYVKPAIKLAASPNPSSSEGFLCRFCKQNRVVPDGYDDVNSIFAEGMFSTTALTIKFKNFFYNMQPDLFVCDVCELLLISAWAGFTEIPYKFRDRIYDTNNIFVNLPSLQLLWDENEKVRNLYAREDENLQDTIYQDVIQDVFLSKQKMKAKWALSNILFIEIRTTPRKDSGRPDFRYFHIGEDVASMFAEDKFAINALDNIYGKVEIGNNLEVNLRRNVVARILEHDSLFPLCYSLVLAHLNNMDSYALRNVFNVSLISSIRASIAAGIERNGGGRALLESKQIYGILKNIQNEGSNFGTIDYEVRKRKSYAMLSMVRNGRIEDFCDTLMKVYMSQSKPVPDSIIGFLNKEDEIGFQARAYAFMSGFLGGNKLQQQQQE